MRAFDHPNMENFRCPICGTKANRPVFLVPDKPTDDPNIWTAAQVHVACYRLVKEMDEAEKE